MSELRRLSIDVFVIGDCNRNFDLQVHLTGIWRPLAMRHDVRVCSWQPQGPSVLAGEPFRLAFMRPRAVRRSGWFSRTYGLLFELMLLARLVLMYRRQRPDAIYVREAVSPAPFAAARLCGIPLLLEVNGALTEEAPSHWFEARLLRPLLRWQARSSTRLLPISETLAGYLTRRHGIERSRMTVVANGADLSLFRPRPEAEAKLAPGLDANRRYICWVGSRAPWHATSELLRAFALLRREDASLRLVLLMRNPQPALLQEIEQLGLGDDVIVKGVPHDQVPDYINAARVCVAPFYDVPRFRLTGIEPLKVGEYLACGRPVVATRLPGLEFIERDNVGLLYAAGNVADLAAALESVLALDESRWQAMSARCRAYAEAHCDWEKLAGRVERELFSVVSG